MATFNELVRTVAELEGMEAMTVRGIGIKIREAGMISKSGRGPSAARMTVQDAASLLIGVNGTAIAKEAADAVQAFRDLRLTSEFASPRDRVEQASILGISESFQRTLQVDTGFGETLAALIAEFVPGEDGSIGFDDEVQVNINFDRPVRRAGLRIARLHKDELGKLIVSISAEFESSAAASPDAIVPDRRDSTTISEKTLRAVGQILAT